MLIKHKSSHKPIESERDTAENKSYLRLLNHDKKQGAMETILYLFLFHSLLHINNFLFCFFVLSCGSTCSLMPPLPAYPCVSETKICVLVHYVPQGKNHLETSSSDLKSQCEGMPTIYNDRAWLQIKTKAGNIVVMQLWWMISGFVLVMSRLKWEKSWFHNEGCHVTKSQTSRSWSEDKMYLKSNRKIVVDHTMMEIWKVYSLLMSFRIRITVIGKIFLPILNFWPAGKHLKVDFYAVWLF